MRRPLHIDVETCPRCGGKMKLAMDFFQELKDLAEAEVTRRRFRKMGFRVTLGSWRALGCHQDLQEIAMAATARDMLFEEIDRQ